MTRDKIEKQTDIVRVHLVSHRKLSEFSRNENTLVLLPVVLSLLRRSETAEKWLENLPVKCFAKRIYY